MAYGRASREASSENLLFKYFTISKSGFSKGSFSKSLAKLAKWVEFSSVRAI